MSWGVAGLVTAVSARRALKLPLVIAACVSFVFGLGELMVPPVGQLTIAPFLYRDDALLGWSLKPSQVSHARAEVEGKVIYDIAYSTDSTGFRVSPPDRGDEVEGCLFFFADSFTFGASVDDEQAFPYLVGLQTNGRFRVVNLSVPGYGAEQMLAAVERGSLATDPPCDPTHVFYVALPHHIHRAAGKTPFSGSGPRYQLNAQGKPEYLGTNLGQRSRSVRSEWGWLKWLRDQARKSRLLHALKNRPTQTTTEDDIALYFAIVRKAFHLFGRRWPEAKLHIISWDVHSFYSNGVAVFHKGLKSVHAQIHLIDDILPGYTQNPVKYEIHQIDPHPNVLAHQLVASYLSERVLPVNEVPR